MARVHLLNTCPGDCTIIEHNSERVTMIDICDGNIPTRRGVPAAHAPRQIGQTDCFRMCDSNTNPIAYARDLGITSIFRFILTHPDMDHMDGFDALVDELGVAHFWDSGSRKAKPSFNGGQFYEADWDRYVSVRDDLEATSSMRKLAGAVFDYANKTDGDNDGIHILAPDAELVNDCNMDDDINDGSYVILYRSNVNRILLPGDAHDNSWNYIRRTRAQQIANVSFLLAPHHGRGSDRSYDFLDWTRPSLTLIGCCPSEYIDYDQWRRRGLDYVTSNQCGNVVLEICDKYLEVYVENLDFVAARRRQRPADIFCNEQGYGFLTAIAARDAAGQVLLQTSEVGSR